MNKFREIFDYYREPVAQLNMQGKSEKTTTFGGFVGLLLTGLILWFLYLRSVILVQKRHPIKYEITEGIDLMSENTPIVNFEGHMYSVGIGMYGVNYAKVC